jgi:hypothetical protein
MKLERISNHWSLVLVLVSENDFPGRNGVVDGAFRQDKSGYSRIELELWPELEKDSQKQRQNAHPAAQFCLTGIQVNPFTKVRISGQL